MVDTVAMRHSDILGAQAGLTLELARLLELERTVRELLVGGHVSADGIVSLNVTIPVTEWEGLIRLLSPTG